ncbi:MAG TPA: hypothetical protein VKZ53_19555 [Candidatus Angelobacter sp.]|nr:hypothetical protein [Candidatus Angelobacter sp.]
MADLKLRNLLAARCCHAIKQAKSGAHLKGARYLSSLTHTNEPRITNGYKRVIGVAILIGMFLFDPFWQ